MFDTGVAQFRVAMSMVWGRRFRPATLARLVHDAVATVEEFGALDPSAREILDGPFADPQARTDFADRALRRTARRLAAASPFYREWFRAAGTDPSQLTTERLRDLPVTTKAELTRQSNAFVCSGTRPALATRTTGTTGRPVEIWMSEYELALWSGLSALTGVLRGELGPADVMQVHVSSRATAAVHLTAATCRLVGARCRVLGVLPADEALDDLVDGATLMSASPSYLAELVLAARRRGLGAKDFRLTRIDAGGEVLSAAVRVAAEATFGARVNDAFGMTEVIPVSATTCSQGHLHHDLSSGLVEVLDLATGRPAEAGALGSVVITPYYPYRETMPVFRFDTRDVVRVLPDASLSCELSGLPATGPIIGKADQLLTVAGRTVSPRELIEAVEALPAHCWPARFAATVRGNRLQLRLPRGAAAGLDRDGLSTHFADRGLPVELELVDDREAVGLRRVRADLRELTFTVPSLIGV